MHSDTEHVELAAAVADARALAREQVSAAWQMHLDRIRDQIESGWRESLDRIFDERFDEVEQRLRSSFESAVGDRSSSLARKEVTGELNNLARRLRQAGNRQEAVDALIDGAGSFCRRIALFDPRQTPLESAPAFASAIDTRDTVVAAGSAAELSPGVTELLGTTPESRVYLTPVLLRGSVIGVLGADFGSAEPNVSALELLAALAAPALEQPAPEPAPELVSIEQAPAPPPRPAWSDLGRSEQEVHLRAQRYARTKVAELVLHQIGKVRDARESQSLYRAFGDEIDAARSEFRQQFFDISPTMVDYLHLELVRTLAKDDAAALGVDYPGPLS